MKVNIDYICKECGSINKITSFWKWLWTPHFGYRKYLKCQHCLSKRHFMSRKNWTGPKWLDWPKDI
jgi:DNA-directed RNA polymerase subunit RPC12/RpoP